MDPTDPTADNTNLLVSQRANDIAAVVHELGLTVEGGDKRGTGGGVVFASSREYDVVLKWHHDVERASAEASALALLSGHGLAPKATQYGNVLAVDHVHPGTTMRDIWETSDLATSYKSLTADLECVAALVANIALLPPGSGAHPVESLLRGDLAASLAAGPVDVGLVLPTKLMESVLGDLASLEPPPGPPLCHGDLHPGNLLWGPSGWLVIDPRGACGDPCADLGRMAASVALGPKWGVDEALEVLCGTSGLDPNRTLVWTRAWLLQIFGHHWRHGVGTGPSARACIELLTV